MRRLLGLGIVGVTGIGGRSFLDEWAVMSSCIRFGDWLLLSGKAGAAVKAEGVVAVLWDPGVDFMSVVNGVALWFFVRSDGGKLTKVNGKILVEAFLP